MSTENKWIPSTEIVRDRYHMANVPDGTPEWIADRSQAAAYAEFNSWLEDLKDQLREEIRAEETPRPSVGEERPATPWPGGGAAKSHSVADIYATSPFAPILIEALDHKPGDFTSEDFKRGYFAATAVTHIRGAAALDSFSAVDERELIAAAAGDRGISSVQADALADELISLGFSRTPQSTDWEYGWRSFFPNGEEYEWLATHSREDAEQQIKDYQEEEDQKFGAGEAEGKLTYSLWRRRKAAAGAWERVEENSDGDN